MTRETKYNWSKGDGTNTDGCDFQVLTELTDTLDDYMKPGTFTHKWMNSTDANQFKKDWGGGCFLRLRSFNRPCVAKRILAWKAQTCPW